MWQRGSWRLIVAGWLLVLSAHTMAQSAADGPTFEVATIKPGATDVHESNVGFHTGHFTTQNATLMFILQLAFNLNSGSNDQVVGAPGWVASAPFDIDAKEEDALAVRIEAMPPEERIETLRGMIQRLLSERFALRYHFETRDLPVIAVIQAKDGSKLKPWVAANAQPLSWQGLHNPAPGEIEGRNATMAMLMNMLASKPEVGGRLVVDKTGLAGGYDFSLRWAPELSPGTAPDASAATGPTLFTAVQEQLGLKMESRKEPVRVLVVDHVERPSAN